MASGTTSIVREFFHHVRLSFFAVIMGMIAVYFWPMKIIASQAYWMFGDLALTAGTFFHLFHYPHITFAAATCFITVFRYSKNYFLATGISFFLPTILCTLSDVLLPYLGGIMFGVQMDLHLCIFCNITAALCFLTAGIILGWLCCYLDGSGMSLFLITLFTHFMHELVSAIASLTYMVGFGFYAWQNHIIPVMFLMLFAVVIPCVLSDFLIPLIAVKIFKKKLGLDHFCCHESM
jgi:hypothetical protein